MLFNLVLIGMNHRTAGVDIRERFNLADKCSAESWQLPRLGGANESLVLSTCNRVEILAAGDESIPDRLMEGWAQSCGCKAEELDRYVYKHMGLEAVRHIFEVASSLDSMVVGEPQILGQLKTAYRNAVQAGVTGPIINKLLHTAFSVAKRVRSETAISANAVSISYAAVELAKRIFGSLPGHRALLLGAGEMAELAAMHLLQAGIEEIIVINRTLKNGQILAEKFRGHAEPFESLGATLAKADIVIASTGSKEPLINLEHVNAALKARKNRPMFFIDIAVPRDIDPQVNTLDNVYLYDIDDLRDVVEENMAARRVEAEAAGKIVEEEVSRFSHWLENLDSKPTIIDLIRRGDEAARIELQRTFRHLKNLDPSVREEIEKMASCLVKRLNHAPIMYLKQTGMGKDNSGARINAVRAIFGLDGSPKEAK